MRSYGTVQGPPSAAAMASRIPSVLSEALAATAPRTTWAREDIEAIYNTPLNQLTYASVSAPMLLNCLLLFPRSPTRIFGEG